MPRNVFEEEKNVPVNETDNSAVKLSGSAEIREKKQRICFPPEPILGTGTGHFHGGSAAGTEMCQCHWSHQCAQSTLIWGQFCDGDAYPRCGVEATEHLHADLSSTRW